MRVKSNKSSYPPGDTIEKIEIYNMSYHKNVLYIPQRINVDFMKVAKTIQIQFFDMRMYSRTETDIKETSAYCYLNMVECEKQKEQLRIDIQQELGIHV